jgi:hypothetical protein
MRSPWYIVVRGNDSDLARLRTVTEHRAELSLEEEAPGEWRLRSTDVEPHFAPEDARSILEDLVVRLADVAAAAGYIRVRVGSGALGRSRGDGASDLWVFPEPIRSRAQVFPPTISVDGVVSEPMEAKLLRLEVSNEHLRFALHFLNADLSWFNLWKSYEAIRDANGGTAASLVATGWTTSSEVDRFRRTANTYSAVGDAARHAKIGEPPPANPMGPEEAEDYVRAMLHRWVSDMT